MTRILPYKHRIEDYVLIRENTGHRKLVFYTGKHGSQKTRILYGKTDHRKPVFYTGKHGSQKTRILYGKTRATENPYSIRENTGHRSSVLSSVSELNSSSNVLLFKSEASSCIQQPLLIAICTSYRKASNHNFGNQNSIDDKSCFIKTSDWFI